MSDPAFAAILRCLVRKHGTPRSWAAALSACLLAGAILAVPVSAFEIPRAKTDAQLGTSPAGAEVIQLAFVAELVLLASDVRSNDVVVEWQEVGGVEPVPFRILIPAGCFVDRRTRGLLVDGFRTCGVQMSVDSSARGFAQLEIVQFRARIVHGDDERTRFDIVTSFIPPDPVVPPDPIIPPDPVRAFLGVLGGAAVEIAIGSEASAAAPLRSETVSGVEPTPF